MATYAVTGFIGRPMNQGNAVTASGTQKFNPVQAKLRMLGNERGGRRERTRILALLGAAVGANNVGFVDRKISYPTDTQQVGSGRGGRVFTFETETVQNRVSNATDLAEITAALVYQTASFTFPTNKDNKPRGV